MNEFLTIFLSAIISYLTAFFTYKFQKKSDFNFEYRKTVLNKRIAAYEKVFDIISRLHRYRRSKNLTGTIHSVLKPHFDGDNQVAIFNSELVELALSKMWLSNSINNKLYELNEFLFGLRQDVKDLPIKEQCEMLVIFFERIEQLRKEINNCYFKDLKQLSNIGAFFTEKISE